MIELSKDLERHRATAPLDKLLQHAEIDIENGIPSMVYMISKCANQLRVQAGAKAWGIKGAH